MSEFKGTPGDFTLGSHDDWSLGYDGRGNAAGKFILNDAGDVIGASLMAHRGFDVPPEMMANANLFAASKVMFEACKNAASLLRKLGGSNHDPEYSELLSAIKKALGQ